MQYFPLKNKHMSEEKHLKLIANGTPILIGLEPHGVLPLQMAAIADYYLFDGAIRTARDHECFKNEEERQRLRDAFARVERVHEHFLRAVGEAFVAVVRFRSNQSVPREESVIERWGGDYRSWRRFGGFEDGEKREVVYLRKRYGFVENRDSIRSGVDAGVRVRGDENVQLVATRPTSDDEKVSRANLEDFIVRADRILGTVLRAVSEERPKSSPYTALRLK